MAGKIPQTFIEDLLGRIDIVDVIGKRVVLKKSGSNYTACCPFHNEKTPSFSVSQTKQFYHCFGCHASGSAISFLMNYDQMHFVDTIEMLASSIGLEVPREDGDQSPQISRKPLFDIMEQCANYYAQHLKTSDIAVKYLQGRELTGATAKKFQLGFSPDGWNNLEQEASIKASSEQLLSLGMQIKNDNGRIYDRFRERIMFPIKDRRGRIIGFGGRILDKGEPKYLNSPETELFHKGVELYGLFEARKSAHDSQQILIVEGYMDVIALSQHGIENAVATLGTATSRSHIETLFRVVPNLIFCFDGDRAGREAAVRALKATLPALNDGRDAHYLFLAEGDDPDSYVSAHGKSAFNELIASAISASDFLIQHISAGMDLTQIGDKGKISEAAKPLLELFPDGIYKTLTINKVEQLLDTQIEHPPAPEPDYSFQDSYEYASSHHEQYTPSRQANNEQQPATPKATANLMRKLATLILQHPYTALEFDASIYTFDNQSTGGQLLQQLIELINQHPKASTATLLENFRETPHFVGLNKLATTALLPENLELSEDDAKQMFMDIIRRLTLFSQKRHAHLVSASHQTGLLSIRKKLL